MCILFVSTSPPPSSPYSLILLSIRDEFFDRPTRKASWYDGVLAGVDLQDKARGTWFGVSRRGRVAVLLSITQHKADKRDDAISRGTIPSMYLRESPAASSPNSFCQSLASRSSDFNGFQFVALQRNTSTGHFSMSSLTNCLVEKIEPQQWPCGSYVFGNSPPDRPFRKVLRGKQLFESIVATITEGADEDLLIKRLLSMGLDTQRCHPDPQLASQTDELKSLFLSSIFVRFPPTIRYGTRCFTVLLVCKNGKARVQEKRLEEVPENVTAADWHTQDFHFEMNNSYEECNSL